MGWFSDLSVWMVERMMRVYVQRCKPRSLTLSASAIKALICFVDQVFPVPGLRRGVEGS